MALEERDHRFDNIKGFLIVLMVFGHLLEPFLDLRFHIRYTYLAIYSFHMPLFAFCSGWSSPSQTPQKLLQNLLYPYLVWQSLYFWFYKTALDRSTMELHYKLPIWVLWYLFSALLWGAAALFLRPKTKRGMVLIVAGALLLGLAAGFWAKIGYDFALSRAVVLFPFYLWGRFFRMRGSQIKQAWCLPAAAAAALGLAALMVWPDFQLAWFYEAQDYAASGGSLFIRAYHYALAGGMTVLILSAAPDRPTLLSRLGEHSMTIFLLHTPLVRYGYEVLWARSFMPPDWIIWPGCLAGAFLLCLLLGNRPVSALIKPLLRFPVPSGKPA